MPIDYSIPLGGQTPAINPMGTFGQAFGAATQMRAQKQQAEENEIKLGQQRQAVADDQAYRDAMREAATPDGKFDVPKALNRLDRTAPAMANGLRKSVLEQTKLDLENHGKKLEVGVQRLALTNQLFDGVTDQASYDTARAQALTTAGPELMAASGLGDIYDPKAVAAARAKGVGIEERGRQQRHAADMVAKTAEATAKALVDDREWQAKQPKLVDEWTSGISAHLLSVDNAEEYADGLAKAQLALQGVPPATRDLIMSKIPPQFSPDGQKQLGILAIDPAKRADQALTERGLRLTAARDAETRRNNLADDARADLKAKGGASFDELGAGDQALVSSIVRNPAMFENLTPTKKTAIAGALAEKGFDAFGRPMSESALVKISDSRSAIGSLRDLKVTLQENEKHIGPIAGLAALNPYSEARTAQAKIDLVRQRVGKALEGGVLRKEDEEKYKKILANLTDVPTTAITKVDQLIESVERDLNTFENEQRRGGRRVQQDDRPDNPTYVGPPGTAAARAAGGPGAAPPPGTYAGTPMVRMQAPDGSPIDVPADKVAEAVKRGAKAVR